MRTVLSFLILSQVAYASGERELVAVLSARVRYSLVPQMNDEPPEIKNRLLNGAAIDAGTVSALEYANLELKSENADLIKENRLLHDNLKATEKQLQAAETLTQDASTQGNGVVAPSQRQPSVEWDRPPVLTLASPVMGNGEQSYHVTVLTQKSCPPCVVLYSDIGIGGFTLDGATVSTKTVDIVDDAASIPAAYRGRTIMTPMVTFDTPHGPRYIEWPMNRSSILRMLRKYGAIQQRPLAASAVGGSMKTHGQIRAFMAAWRDKLGDGSEVRCRIDKTGDQRLSVTRLIHGEPWTQKQVCGKFGRVELSTTAKLPLQKAGFTYRLEDDGRFTIDADPLTIGLPSAQGYGASGKAVGMDPVTIGLSIIQIANALYQILNPQIDCILPGTMSFVAKVDGETLTIKFDDAPSIHVSAWLQFDLGVKTVTVTPTNVHVGFDTEAQKRNWIRIESRDFGVDDN